MTRIHWFLIALALQFEVNIEGTSTGSVVCNDNHTVTITIMDVTGIAEFTESDWRIDNKTECEPTFSGTKVTYTNLPVGTCASTSEEQGNKITYVFQIRALPPGGGPTQALDHMFDASCAYTNNNTVTASFIPLTSRGGNASDAAFFTFTLGAFTDADLSTPLSGQIALNQPLYFKAEVVTSSSSPNLDLFIVSCHSSKQNDPDSLDGKVVLIQNGCGNDTVSQDNDDTLFYNCTNDSIQESFSINSFRYFGVDAGESVFVHCDLRVCLENTPNSECECPTVAECDPSARKRRSVSESVVYRISTGPFYLKNEEEYNDDDEDPFEETRSEDQGPFYLNLAIVLAVSGIVIAAIACLTVFLLLRKRQQRFSVSEKNKACDLNVKT